MRIFGVGDAVSQRLAELADETAARQRGTRFLGELMPSLYATTALLLVVASLALVYATGVSGLASLGAVILIMLRSLNYGGAVQTSLQTLHELAPYFETLQAEKERYEAAALPRGGDPVGVIGELAFERVWFEYIPGYTVLRDVSFRVPRGEIVGIVGPTGAGKSTLVQLLLRLREPTSGRLLVDRREARDLDLDDWYRTRTFLRARWRRTSPSSVTMCLSPPSREQQSERICTTTCWCFPTGTRRGPGSGAGSSPAVSVSASASPGRSSKSRTSSCSTSRPARSTPSQSR